MLYIDLRHGQTGHSKDGGSCIFNYRGRAWLTIWDRVKIPRYSHKLMHRKRVTIELNDSYFRSRMIQTCHSKDGRSGIFRWPFMRRDWVGVELLYNSVHWKFNQLETRCGRESQHPAEGALRPPIESWGSDELEIRCGRENHHPERLGPRPSVEQPRRTGKKRWWP